MTQQQHISPENLPEYLMNRFYGQPLIANVYRGDYVEGLILCALGQWWKQSFEWGSWDLENAAGVRLEVKQSAALQSWYKQTGVKKSSPSFSITPKTGYYTDSTDAAVWVPLPAGERVRPADIYVLAWHPEPNPEIADHHNPEQWQFFVVPADNLPPKPPQVKEQRIGLAAVKKLATAVTYDRLAAEVDKVAAGLPSIKAEKLTAGDRRGGGMDVVEHSAAATGEPERRLSSGKSLKHTEATLIDSFDDPNVQDAAKRLIEVAHEHQVIPDPKTSSITISMRCAAWKNPITVAWLYEPGAVGWGQQKGFFFGAGNNTEGFFESLPQNLREVLDNWVEEFSQDAFATEVLKIGIKAWHISHQDAAANIDLLAERLGRVLQELRELPASS